MHELMNGNWCIARDPENRGRERKWYDAIPEGAEIAPVPGIIQQVFPDYHGVAWYWTRFTLPSAPTPVERIVLRFGAVDYMAEVWVNGTPVGGHEGGETPFELDATAAARPGENLLAVRVLNPGNERIDGLVLEDVPRRNRAVPFRPGCSYNAGGIPLPVEVASVPAIRIVDVCARLDWLTGDVQVAVVVRNDTANPVRGRVEASIGPRLSGEAQAAIMRDGDFPPGDSEHALVVKAGPPHLWSVDDPFLYLLTVDLAAGAHQHRLALHIGYRDFRGRRKKLPADFGACVIAAIYPPQTPFKTVWEIATEPAPAKPIAQAAMPADATRWLPDGRRFEKEGLVNFHAFAPNRGGIMYARGDIEAPADMTCDPLVGTDGPLKVWLDGNEVGTVRRPAIRQSRTVFVSRCRSHAVAIRWWSRMTAATARLGGSSSAFCAPTGTSLGTNGAASTCKCRRSTHPPTARDTNRITAPATGTRLLWALLPQTVSEEDESR